MANRKHLAILKKGVAEWNRWINDDPNVIPDLRNAPLRNAELDGINFEAADLRGADLRGAALAWAKFFETDLVGAKLAGAHFTFADFTGEDLSGVDFSRASLTAANLTGAQLVGAKFRNAQVDQARFFSVDCTKADFSGASLYQTLFVGGIVRGAKFSRAKTHLTVFTNVALGEAEGLESVDHRGPSSLGLDAVLLSKGNIPEKFLRGCGIPEESVVYVRSMVGRPIEYYSCFISYSTKDQAFADRLYADLQAKGVRCWFAPHDIMGGRKIHEQIDEAIRVHDKLLLILSEHSMASDWVGTEIANAREREAREKKKMLFPITIAPFEEVKKWTLFDADRGKDSAREIREYHIPDFSEWKRNHTGYQKEFEKLVAALKSVVNR